MKIKSISVPVQVTRLMFVAALGLAVCAPQPVAAQDSPFKIVIDYSGADSELFTQPVKDQIDGGARFLRGFISDNRTVTVKVVADNDIKALASGATSAWDTNQNNITVPTKGSIAFNTNTIVSARDQNSSIVALTIHELLHVLAFSEAHKAYESHIKDGEFRGPVTLKMNNGAGVLSSRGHFDRNVRDVFGIAPRMVDGGGDLLSVLDLAVLADVGYDIPVLHDATTAPMLAFTLRPADSMRMTLTDEESGEKTQASLLQGYGGNDTLIAGEGAFLMAGAGGDDTIVGGPGNDEMRGDNTPGTAYGKDGKDTFVIAKGCGNDEILDLDVGTDVIMLSPDLGFADAEAAFAQLKKKTASVPGNPNMVMTYPGTWTLKIGDNTLSIATKDKQMPTLANFEVEKYDVPK